MPDPRSSLGSYEYKVAFLSGISPLISNKDSNFWQLKIDEYSDHRQQVVDEYIESIVGLNSIVVAFETCFDADEIVRAKKAIRLAAATLAEFPLSEISLRKDILEILERERLGDINDYEYIRKNYIDSIQANQN